MKKIIFAAILLLIPSIAISLSISEKARRILNDRFDRLHLRNNTSFVIDQSPRILISHKESMSIQDYTIASTPPLIKMMIVPINDHSSFSDSLHTNTQFYNFNPPTRTSDGKFIFAVSNCLTHGGKIFLFEYDPGRDKVEKVIDVSHVFGWTDSMHTEGKIHGKMGLMPDDTLWGGTKYGALPEKPWFDKENPGSRIFSWNTKTGESHDWGVPLPGNTFGDTMLDTKRNKLFAVGEFPSVLCWDINKHKSIYADIPPNGWIWYSRTILLDENGKFWGTDTSDSTEYRFLSYDPKNNHFERYDLSTPENLYYHERERLRACTMKRAADGAFWCFTYNGVMFRFWPEKPAVEQVDINWDQGRYTSTVAMDPTGRYLYYMPGDTRLYNADTYGPIVQYDTKTRKKKVLAWLVDYYYEKYGYWVGGTYGMEISNDGSFLVIVMNGAFRIRDDAHDNPYEYPSLFVVHIPESERPTD